MTDYPKMAAERGRIEPAPRRVRGFLGHELVFDTTAARYVWEVPYYPQYYIPLADVRSEFLRDEDHPQKVQLGPSRLHSLIGAGQTHETAAGCSTTATAGRGHSAVRMGPAALVRGGRADLRPSPQPLRPRRRAALAPSHPRRSSTASCSPTPSRRSCCSKPALPTRYYIDPTDVAFEHLELSDTETLCPYKGTTSEYWSVRAGDTVHQDLAWTYHYPLPAVAPIAGLVAFYNEKLDIIVDGIALARPKTHFS